MKKTLFLAVLASAALAGCVKNEEAVKSDSSPERITFEAPVVSVPTRATEIYGNFPKEKTFAVYALYHADNFASVAESSRYMTNVTCTADNTTTTPTTWNPATDYYWPKGGKLTFVAYHPVMTHIVTEDSPEGTKKEVELGADGLKFIGFEVESNADDQYDLLYSEFQKNKQQSDMVTDQPYDGITIPFKHALSSILFKVGIMPGTLASGNLKSITLTRIEVKNVVGKGDFLENTDNNASWTVNYGTLTDYVAFTGNLGLREDLQLVNGEVDNDKDGGSVNAGESYDETEGGKTPDAPENTNDGVRRSDLILIPQKLRGGTTDDGCRGTGITDAVVQVSYTIVYTNTDGVDVTDQVVSPEFKLAVKGETNEAATIYNWEMGKRYIYNITIGLEEIHFNPQVVNWDDREGKIEI